MVVTTCVKYIKKLRTSNMYWTNEWRGRVSDLNPVKGEWPLRPQAYTQQDSIPGKNNISSWYQLLAAERTILPLYVVYWVFCVCLQETQQHLLLLQVWLPLVPVMHTTQEWHQWNDGDNCFKSLPEFSWCLNLTTEKQGKIGFFRFTLLLLLGLLGWSFVY